MKTVAIIQARMSSSRLPGKVLADIAGRPMLTHVVRRAQRAKKINLVTVATSYDQSDDVLAELCTKEGIPCFRGNLDDVLDRYYQAARFFDADVVVRLTADCPLLDPAVIDKVVTTFFNGNFDFVSNARECTYPDGLDTSVFRRTVLEQAWKEAKLKSEREHVTAYIIKNPQIFRLGSVCHTEDLSSMRWTVDEKNDLEFVRAVFRSIGKLDFGLSDVLHVLKKQPEMQTINTGIIRNEGYIKSLKKDNVEK